MSLLDDLYREIILDHYRNPRGRDTLDHPDIVQEGANPLCGDELTLSLKLGDGKIERLRQDGHGCSISQASASMMAETLRGLSLEESEALMRQVKAMLKGESHDPLPDDLEDLAALEGVRKYPVRIKCALLAWTTLEEALKRIK
ncbi:MAG: SUF system NifU family Fe-S cluster assembly protein [Armatimonadetes bacterium]|nr:SUF system NifU family Fe-S cluster assembly protein [Armatimonadota bacterium]